MAKFNEYRSMMSTLALRALETDAADARPAVVDDKSILMAAPAARLLIDLDAAHPPESAADPYALLAKGLQLLATLGRSHADSPIAMTDAGGQTRSTYHPLVLHLHLAAFERGYDQMSPSCWSMCEAALPDALLPAQMVADYCDGPPPPELTDQVLWQALCLLDYAMLMQRDVDIELVDSAVHAALSRPGQSGALHERDPDESPDSWIYRELTGLHALANIALKRRNSAWAKRVQEIAMYHQDHTQPDFVTYQPWALFAFCWSPKTAMFAEQQLHDCQSWLGGGAMGSGSRQSAPGGKIIAGLLLADAANALATFSS